MTRWMRHSCSGWRGGGRGRRLARPTPRALRRPGRAAVEHRLATILRRLAGVLRAEPFAPSEAAALGAAVVEPGLCGEPPAADGLAASLRLLRAGARAALGVPGIDGARLGRPRPPRRRFRRRLPLPPPPPPLPPPPAPAASRSRRRLPAPAAASPASAGAPTASAG